MSRWPAALKPLVVFGHCLPSKAMAADSVEVEEAEAAAVAVADVAMSECSGSSCSASSSSSSSCDSDNGDDGAGDGDVAAVAGQVAVAAPSTPPRSAKSSPAVKTSPKTPRTVNLLTDAHSTNNLTIYNQQVSFTLAQSLKLWLTTSDQTIPELGFSSV